MPKFKFKLQPVLEHRQKKEDIFKKELAEVKKRFESEKLLLEELKQKLFDLQSELREKQKSSFEISDIAAYSSYIDRVEGEIELKIIKLTEIAEDVKKAQKRLLEASKDKKILEKLHERKYEEFQKELERIEQGLIDELATIRHGRKQLMRSKES